MKPFYTITVALVHLLLIGILGASMIYAIRAVRAQNEKDAILLTYCNALPQCKKELEK